MNQNTGLEMIFYLVMKGERSFDKMKITVRSVLFIYRSLIIYRYVLCVCFMLFNIASTK